MDTPAESDDSYEEVKIIDDVDATAVQQLSEDESLHRAMILLQECTSSILNKNTLNTAIVRKHLGRTDKILLWDRYVSSSEYCGRELGDFFTAPLNALKLDLNGLIVTDISKSLLWNAVSINNIDGLDIVFTTSNVTTNGKKCYYYEITVHDKYDMTCIIF